MSTGQRWTARLSRRRLIGASATAGLATVGLGVAWPARCSGKFYPGVAVAGLDLGGLSREAALHRLRERFAPFERSAVTYRLGDRTWDASAADLGVRVAYDETLDRAWQHGRADGVGGRYATLLGVGDHQEHAPILLALDEAALDRYLAELDAEISRDARDAALTVEGVEVAIEPERHGVQLDLARARTETMGAIRAAAPGEVALHTSTVEPDVTTADLQAAREQIAAVIGDDVAITYGDAVWTVSREELAAALRVPDDPTTGEVAIDPAALMDALAPIGDAVDHPPQDATIAWRDGGLVALTESYDGAVVDPAALAAMVAAATVTAERTVELPLIYTPPAVDARNLDALGISRLVASGASSFAGSSPERATNVAVAAEHVSQTLIPPGGTFSFNDALGPITLDEGYVEGKIILGDWYASDLGGGVCQVSTTVYRAALLAGLPFAEWHPHTFRLGFYELDGWPVGMDAAIYQPNTPDEWELDLQFVNPFDFWLLLQKRIDGETVTAELYGAPTGYAVDVADPALGEATPPPPPVERESADLEPGEREQVQTAQPGVTVTLTRRVVKDGAVLSEETFVSPYEAQADVFLIGA